MNSFFVRQFDENVIETHPKLKKYNPNYLRYPDSPMLVEDIGKTPVTKDEIELELMQEILDKKKEIILLKKRLERMTEERDHYKNLAERKN